MNTFNVSFLCSPSKRRKNGLSPVEVSLIVNKQRLIFPIGKFCRPEDFRELYEAKQPNDINMYCNALLLRINQWQTQLYLENKTANVAKIKSLIQGKQEKHESLKDCVNGYLNNCVKSTCAYSKYKNTFTRFLDFAGDATDIESVKPQTILDYKLKYEKVFAPGTLRNEIKKVKSLFTWAFNSGIINKTPFATLRFSFKDPEQPYLTQEEVDRIRKAKLDDRLDTVRNFFLFLCYSGLEYTDMVHLEKSDVKRSANGQLYIKKPRIKSGITYLSVLFEDAAEMWELFEGDIPMISNAKTNAYLKEIAKIAKIDKKVTTLTGRHTYACYLLNECAIPVDIVQKMLGHATARQSLHYAKMLDDTVLSVAKAAQRPKINETKTDAEDLQKLEEAIAALKNQGE